MESIEKNLQPNQPKDDSQKEGAQMPNFEQLVLEKSFRSRENMIKIDYILGNSGITKETIEKSAKLSNKNPYHNFDHTLGVTEHGIRIAIAEGRTKEEINTIALAALFHDAGHGDVAESNDETNAANLAIGNLDDSDTIIAGDSRHSVLLKVEDLILATKFPEKRGKIENGIIKIIQDADLAHIGQGYEYWLWSSMSFMDELNKTIDEPLTPESFIKDFEEKFVESLSKMSKDGKVYLSQGANNLFKDPKKDILILKKLPLEAINYAYETRDKDITLKEFKEKIHSLKLES